MQLQSWTDVDDPSSQPDAKPTVKPSAKPSFSQSLRDFLAGDCDQDQVLDALDRSLAAEKSRPAALRRIVSHQHAQNPLPAKLLQELNDRIGAALGDNDSSLELNSVSGSDESESSPVISDDPELQPPTEQAASDDSSMVDTSGFDDEETRYLPPEQTPQAKSLPAIGRVLNDRFILEELVGQGGMSLVYRAVDKRKLEARSRNPYVAVKILEVSAKNKDAAFMALQREVQKSEILYHPNIVRAIDFDRDGDTVFMTLEFLSGRPLSTLIKEMDTGGMAVKPAMELIAQMGAALQHAHQHGIVHADFKPGNVMLTDDNEIRVIDFGIARAYKQPEDPDADKTVFDPRSLGALTPAYASPEMLENQEPDPRDDVYSLGCVAYELLTGHHPFSRARATEARQTGAKPRKPEHLSYRQWRALAKALSFEREQRSSSVAELLNGLLPGSNRPWWLAAGLGAAALAAFVWWNAANHTAPLEPVTAEQTPAATPVVESPVTDIPATAEPTPMAPAEPTPTYNRGDPIQDCANCPALLVLPAGSATIGSPATEVNRREFEGPSFVFALGQPIAMGATEVTVAQFAEFVEANPASAPDSGCLTYEQGTQPGWQPNAEASWQQPGFTQNEQHPVTCVSFVDAQNYTAWLSSTTGHSYRLPTEAEWEYAARAETMSAQNSNYWDNQSETACAHGNFADADAIAAFPGWAGVSCSDGSVFSAPVAQQQANNFGLFDMQGNQFEWTSSCWTQSYREGTPTNCTQRVLRGGSWYTDSADLRLAYRNRAALETRTTSFGFRVVRELP